MGRLRRLAWVVAWTLVIGVAAPAVLADAYPSRPVRLIIGFPPGSAADVTARVLANQMSRSLGQQVIIENKPGAGSSLAADFVVRAPKDGYTLFLGSSANLTNAIILSNLAFDFTKDLAPIALVTSAAVILAVHPSTGVTSVSDLIALAKSKPGEILYASTGVGTAPHLSGELFNVRTGVKMVHVPYQGSPQAVTDLLAGRVSVMFSPASTVVAQIKAGNLKGIASTASKRPAIAADLPTMAEAGLPDFETSIWFGLMAPAGTPREVIDKLAAAANEAIKDADAVAKLRLQGVEALGGTPEQFAEHIQREVKKWSAAAQAAGLKK